VRAWAVPVRRRDPVVTSLSLPSHVYATYVSRRWLSRHS